VLVCFDHAASVIVNANHGIMRAAEMLRVSDCVRNGIWLGVPQCAKRQPIGNWIDTATIYPTV